MSIDDSKMSVTRAILTKLAVLLFDVVLGTVGRELERGVVIHGSIWFDHCDPIEPGMDSARDRGQGSAVWRKILIPSERSTRVPVTAGS